MLNIKDSLCINGYNTDYRLFVNGNIGFSGNVIPGTNNTYTLGSATLKWKNIYATTFTGNATSSSKVNNKLTIKTDGSIDSVTSESYDGSAAISVSAGNAYQDMTGAETGAANSVNANMIDGKTLAQIILTLYPVGAIYTSTISTNPGTLFGGVWTQIQNQFLLAAGSSYAAGNTGGSATHAHSQGISGAPSTNSTGGPSTDTTGAPSTNSTGGPSTNTTGGPSNNNTGGPSNNSTGTPSSNSTGAPSTNTTGSTALTVAQMPAHDHTEWIKRSSSEAGGYGLVGSSAFQNRAMVTSQGVSDSYRTDSVGSGSGHTHTLSSHTHSLNSHTHSLNSHTHTLSSHTHTLSSHTHSLNSHTHTLSSHTHSLNLHTHTNPNTDSASNMPPYLVVYMWKRIS